MDFKRVHVGRARAGGGGGGSRKTHFNPFRRFTGGPASVDHECVCLCMFQQLYLLFKELCSVDTIRGAAIDKVETPKHKNVFTYVACARFR